MPITTQLRSRPSHWRRAPIVVLLLGACRTGRDYQSPTEPRYAGAPPGAAVERRAQPDRLRIVSFNIEFARRIDGAIALLASDTALRGADVILLQEMDAAGTQRVAHALGMWYVYYPAILHRRTRRDFGNAILSRWPIVDDAKVVLPHASRYARTHRTATAATLRLGALRVRAYSTHLGTALDIGSGRREDQLRAILADAAEHPFVVIGGDLNEATIGLVAEEAGYSWPTRDGPRTTRFGRWDHIFLKGFESPDTAASGTVADVRGVSDHRPVWTVGILRRGGRVP
jgi:endonuclease/exonuclease/phosphatase family metal-dependent hydrolase